MGLGDYVWFRTCDDLYCGETYSEETKWMAGKILKIPNSELENQYDFRWVASLPVSSIKETVPLWAISINKLKKLTPEEAMLAMLENT